MDQHNDVGQQQHDDIEQQDVPQQTRHTSTRRGASTRRGTSTRRRAPNNRRPEVDLNNALPRGRQPYSGARVQIHNLWLVVTACLEYSDMEYIGLYLCTARGIGHEW